MDRPGTPTIDLAALEPTVDTTPSVVNSLSVPIPRPVALVGGVLGTLQLMLGVAIFLALTATGEPMKPRAPYTEKLE
mgnify:CR=1 FL=1